jgi:hypothetical protein
MVMPAVHYVDQFQQLLAIWSMTLSEPGVTRVAGDFCCLVKPR